jgi:serine protease Do
VQRKALGTGVIVDPAGRIITNAYVVEGATAVKVRLSDDRELDATVKGRDTALDIALLEVQGGRDLPYASLGSSEKLRVGEYVVAIGNPFGLGHTVTMGIVSAKGRELGAGAYDDFIQTDASINPGNSGGPLFDLHGQVIGINTAINAAAQGIGFAIPVDAVKDVLPQLVATGHVRRGRLGVAIEALDADAAKRVGLDRPRGALVREVEPGGPAQQAGLRPGDVIVGVEGAEVVHAHDLPRLVARHPPGSRIELRLRRGRETTNVAATLAELPEPKNPPSP